MHGWVRWVLIGSVTVIGTELGFRLGVAIADKITEVRGRKPAKVIKLVPDDREPIVEAQIVSEDTP
jgi:hypothetical protein